jgi:hypothetical protein
MEKSWQIAERIWSAELSPTEKLVALAVLHHRNSDTGKCFPSRERLALVCGLSVRVVQRALAQLKADGVLRQCGMMGRFALMEFVPRVNLRVMGDAHDTPGVTHTSYVGPFKPIVGESLEQETTV